MHVLRNMVDATRPGGLVLDLQVIRPNPVVETDGGVICEIDGEPLFERADAARAAIESEIAAGNLAEESRDDHDVRTHYPSGQALVDAFAGKTRRVLNETRVRTVTRPCLIRERCRLRRLRVA